MDNTDSRKVFIKMGIRVLAVFTAVAILVIGDFTGNQFLSGLLWAIFVGIICAYFVWVGMFDGPRL